MSKAPALDPILTRIDERGVAYVTLNRPEVYNAYNDELLAALSTAIETLSRKSPRAIVIAGNGKNFQAGADINWLDAVRRASPEENLRASRAPAEAVQRLNMLPVPTIALVHGACFGGGTGLIAACDVVVATENAMFSIAEVRIGVAATIIVPQLNDAIGVRQMRRYALTGERFDVKEAHRIGLVHEVVPLADLPAAGERIVSALLASGPDAVALTKACILQHAWSDLPAQDFSELIDTHAAKRQSAEAAEGFAAFLEKRPPRWSPQPRPKP
ncbi:MAG TPA: enoyl-CoA hydratase-related protein [Pseudolabrys sp.]|nr:enoyl-CoA hydratase-related protein [Pseudolabrys sp.]